jgi:hypothetical protein
LYLSLRTTGKGIIEKNAQSAWVTDWLKI